MLGNLVKETANNPGTGTSINLAGAPSGFVTFLAAFGNGQPCFYVITDGLQSEVQVGNVAAGSPNTLTRGNPIWTSTGAQGRLNFTGAVTIFNALPAERSLWADAAAVWQARGRRLAGLIDGIDPGDAPRLSQLPMRLLSATTVGSSVGLVSFTLPAGFTRWRVEFEGMTPAAAAAAYMRIGNDGGALTAGANDYGSMALVIKAGSTFPAAANGSYFPLSDALNTYLQGMVELSGGKLISSDTVTINTTPALSRYLGAGNHTPAGTPTQIALGFVNQNVIGGRFRLLGAN